MNPLDVVTAVLFCVFWILVYVAGRQEQLNERTERSYLPRPRNWFLLLSDAMLLAYLAILSFL